WRQTSSSRTMIDSRSPRVDSFTAGRPPGLASRYVRPCPSGTKGSSSETADQVPGSPSEGESGEDEYAVLGDVEHRGAETFPAHTGFFDATVGHLVSSEAGHVSDDDAPDIQFGSRAEGQVDVPG